MPGAELGNGVIVGARSVLRGRVPDFAIVTGNPAKVVRMRYDAETVARLLAVAWWDMPKSKIETALPAIEIGDVSALEKI